MYWHCDSTISFTVDEDLGLVWVARQYFSDNSSVYIIALNHEPSKERRVEECK